MINRKELSALGLTAALAFATLGCGQPASNTVSNANSNAVLTSNTANGNAAASNSSGSAAATAVNGSSDPAESPSAAYRAAHAARKNKDIAALKKLFSKDVIGFLTMLGTADPDKKQSLDDVLKELCEQPQAETAESRNEKIDGDKATIEYKDEKGDWETMDFVKEDGIWKLTINAPAGDPADAKTPKK